jgi:DNA-directed RNA polymerase I and III subunit RPAC2
MPESVHSQDHDQSMVDAEQPAHEAQEVVSNDPILEERQIVVVRTPFPNRARSITNADQLPGATDTAASFQFEGEGHTMGNALRYAIMKK